MIFYTRIFVLSFNLYTDKKSSKSKDITFNLNSMCFIIYFKYETTKLTINVNLNILKFEFNMKLWFLTKWNM